VQRRLRMAMDTPDDARLLREACDAVARGRLAEGLRLVLRCRQRSVEALLLASDCQDWLECMRLMQDGVPGCIGLEAAQLMADTTTSPDLRTRALDFLGGEESRRRRAGLEYRRGNAGEARRLLATDWEARFWIRDG
jgi:hypothetical protein